MASGPYYVQTAFCDLGMYLRQIAAAIENRLISEKKKKRKKKREGERKKKRADLGVILRCCYSVSFELFDGSVTSVHLANSH